MNHGWGWGGHGAIDTTSGGGLAVGSGTIAGGIPVAFPVKNPGWAASWGGTAHSNSFHASAEAATSISGEAP
ncbi:hypothetical protein ACP70R_048398 [Stipagrostis hirtigluma subsp. patula]